MSVLDPTKPALEYPTSSKLSHIGYYRARSLALDRYLNIIIRSGEACFLSWWLEYCTMTMRDRR